MSEDNKSAGQSGANAATDYVNEQLTAARASLGRTKMVAVIIIIIVLGYMSFVTKSILAHLEPQQAANTAKGVITVQLAERGEILADQLKAKIPEMMQKLPEVVLNRMPEIRESIQNRISAELKNYARKTADQLEPQLDEFLTNHTDDINKFLNASQDLDALREDLNDDLDALIANYLKNTTDGSETLLEKFEQSQVLLNNIADHTQRLAHDEDLTDREKQTRRAVAVLLVKADFKLYDNTRHSMNDDEHSE
jgi:hypothetical protein